MAPGSPSLDLRSQARDAAWRLGRTWPRTNSFTGNWKLVQSAAIPAHSRTTCGLWMNRARANSMNETLEAPVDRSSPCFRSAWRCKFREILDHHRQTDPMSTLRPSRTHWSTAAVPRNCTTGTHTCQKRRGGGGGGSLRSCWPPSHRVTVTVDVRTATDTESILNSRSVFRRARILFSVHSPLLGYTALFTLALFSFGELGMMGAHGRESNGR